MPSAFPSDRGDWVSMLAGVRISRAWMVRHTPDLLAAWCDAATAEGRRAIATRILQIAADLESEPEHGDDAATDPAWRQLVARIDARLAERLGIGCPPGRHTDWPARSWAAEYNSRQATAARQALFDGDLGAIQTGHTPEAAGGQ